jgi:hypothetical protein
MSQVPARVWHLGDLATMTIVKSPSLTCNADPEETGACTKIMFLEILFAALVSSTLCTNVCAACLCRVNLVSSSLIDFRSLAGTDLSPSLFGSRSKARFTFLFAAFYPRPSSPSQALARQPSVCQVSAKRLPGVSQAFARCQPSVCQVSSYLPAGTLGRPPKLGRCQHLPSALDPFA